MCAHNFNFQLQLLHLFDKKLSTRKFSNNFPTTQNLEEGYCFPNHDAIANDRRVSGFND